MTDTTISNYAFDEVPVNNRVPGTHIEVKPAVGVPALQYKSLMLVQRTSEGLAALAPGPHLVTGDGSIAREWGGPGSLAHLMVKTFRANNNMSELWVYVMDGDPTGTVATGTVTFTGPATETRQCVVYVGMARVPFLVEIGDTPTEIAEACAAAINADVDLPVTATAAVEVVTVTFKHKGLCGNDQKLRLANLNQRPSERLPHGVGVTFSNDGYLAGGSGNPDNMGVITAVRKNHFDFVCLPHSDDFNLDQWRDEWRDRWSPQRHLWGVGVTYGRGTPAELHTIGSQRNSPFLSMVGLLTGSPVPGWMRCASYFAKLAKYLEQGPARPLHTLPLVGEEEYGPEFELEYTDQQTLLSAGISLTMTNPNTGEVMIHKAITTYQTNAWGDRDESWHLVNTPATLALICRQFMHHSNTNWLQPRLIFANDDDRIDAPNIKPKRARAQLVSLYGRMVNQGLTSDVKRFGKDFIRVARSSEQATRMNILLGPQLAAPLLNTAFNLGFYLDFPEQDAA